MMMNNSVNGSSTAGALGVGVGGGLKTYFKTPEGKYKLHLDKTHPASLLPFSHAKSLTFITLAQLKERVAQATSFAPSSSYSATSGVRYVASRFLGSGNGNRALSFVGGNGLSKANGGPRSSSFGGLNGSGSSYLSNSNFDGKGTYLIFNVGDSVYVTDLSSQDKDPIKAIHFSNSNPVCHAFDSEAKDGHDFLIGLSCGDVYSVSLRQQLQDVGKKIVGAQHYNKDGSTSNSRCTSVGWIPGRDGTFVVAHADGNLYVYEKNKDGTGDASFPVIKDQTQFSVAHAKSSKSNPIARWHICQGPINSVSFSNDGKYLATVGRDGFLRVFDYSNEQLICGGKSYYGSLLCCAWSGDGKYILTGGEDDLVQVWSMEDRKIVAWGEGHNSWVSGVAFDPYWLPPTSEDTEENAMYRFGSVGQDTQLLLWDLSMDEIVVPLRRCPPGGSPTFSVGSQSSHWDNAVPVGTLQPAPSMRDVPKLAPVGKDSTLLGWLLSFFKQFFASVTKSDYTTMRLGFIMTHCRANPKFNFHKYMIRTLEADFKKVVGMSWYLWLVVVVFLLLNVHGWHAYFYISFIPLILLLVVGTKLEHVINQLAQEVAEKHVAIEGDLVVQPSDDHFWFNKPRLVLLLIHIILFQNSFEIAIFFWVWVQYGFDSCIMGQIGYVIPRLVIGVFIQLFCSYSTLPLYAIVTQMGSSFKKAIFEEHIQKGVVDWAIKAKKNKLLRKVSNSSSQIRPNASPPPTI